MTKTTYIHEWELNNEIRKREKKEYSKEQIKAVFTGTDKKLMKEIEKKMKKSGQLLRGEVITAGVDY